MPEHEQKGTAVVAAKRKAVVTWRGTEVAFTGQDVRNLICPKATDQEIIVFLRTCESLQLNPFAGECYLIKYSDTEKAAFVIDIDSFHKAAETNNQYDGFEAGIILVRPGGGIEHREGAFLTDGERGDLAGGWAKVYRKDRSRPYYVAIHKAECIRYTREGKLFPMWIEPKQPWMLRKVALKRALVEAFASLFAGTMATAEVGGGIDAEYREIPEDTLPAAMEKDGKPDWPKFWTRVKSELGLTQTEARDLLGVKSIKREIVDAGINMETLWNSLVHEVQKKQMADNVVDGETGEIITPEKEKQMAEEPGEEIFPEEGASEPESEAPTKPKRDPNSIKNLGQLFTACKEDFGLYSEAVCKELGYGSPNDISKLPSDCYREIAAVRR